MIFFRLFMAIIGGLGVGIVFTLAILGIAIFEAFKGYWIWESELFSGEPTPLRSWRDW